MGKKAHPKALGLDVHELGFQEGSMMAQEQIAKELNETHNLLGSRKEAEPSSLSIF